ncbi:MAG: CheA signal transduction histidine kinase [Cyanobacteria bacterium RYN_339]|nr:CheA signal transduction histidine kinase [Cyanobacteria bacterium RYN_339]
MTGKDRYKYFRIEARELLEGLAADALAAEKAGGAALVARMLRLAHTLKGASRVVGLPDIADNAHAIEDQLADYRDAEAPLPTPVVAALWQLIDACQARMANLDAPPPPAGTSPVKGEGVPVPARPPAPSLPAVELPVPPPPRPRDDEAIETVRVSLQELDTLLESIAEAGVRVKGLQAQLEALGAQAAPLRPALDRAGLELADARDQAQRLRLVPASRIFHPLERAARDAAALTRRKIDFLSDGGEIRLDGHVLHGVRDALMHAVRNAVDHGIEPEADRLAAGKPAAGQVTVEVVRRGARVAFRCVDDGRGLDDKALRAAAVRRGILTVDAATALNREQSLELVFAAGLSTRTQVTDLSGRGVGMDVVRDMARRLKGEASITSTPGRGTAVTIEVPLSLSAIAVLELQVGRHVYSLPLDRVKSVIRLVEPPGATLDYGGREVPYVPLAALLPDVPPGRPTAAVVLEDVEGAIALGVDGLLGAVEVVVKPLPSALGSVGLVQGAAFDASGVPRPVLDARGLVAASRGRPIAVAPVQAPAKLKPILVIDDSLTTRMLEQSILESAGFEVDLAVHAEQGMEKARLRDYGLYIVDVEMPGMNGYEFVALTRQDPVMGRVPAVLVTSLASPENRRRGQEAGASAYIVKGDFEQGRFLDTVRRLLTGGG